MLQQIFVCPRKEISHLWTSSRWYDSLGKQAQMDMSAGCYRLDYNFGNMFWKLSPCWISELLKIKSASK